jgi:hypothetical protein
MVKSGLARRGEPHMALYKNPNWIGKSDHAAFDKEYKPGDQPDHSGIYRCLGCGREVVGEEQRKLPPQNHHQHTQAQGEIRWKMAVYADHQAK